MPAKASAQILPAELAQIVESVFAVMLGLEVRACDVPWFPSADRWTAAVHLTGSWNGAVLLECDRAQARRFAGRFLPSDLPAPADDVVRDTLGELVNMIGSNMKAVLAPGIRVSMPAGNEGCSSQDCGAAVGERETFRSTEGLFWISVVVKQVNF
jgi:CheY-specific phosphatase CheX